MLRLASCPIIERLALDLADQPRGLWAFPLALVAVLLRGADPPALAREPVRLANDQHRKFRLAARLGFLIDIGEHLAQGAHLWPREMMPEKAKDFGIADRLSRLRRCDQDCTHLARIGQQPRALAHPAGCCATG